MIIFLLHQEREIQRLRALLASYTSTSGGAISSAGPGTQPPWQHWAKEGIASQASNAQPACMLVHHHLLGAVPHCSSSSNYCALPFIVDSKCFMQQCSRLDATLLALGGLACIAAVATVIALLTATTLGERMGSERALH